MSNLKTLVERLDDFEKRVLRICCGENLIAGRGAAVEEALRVLRHAGLTTAQGLPTALGREVAAALRMKENKDE